MNTRMQMQRKVMLIYNAVEVVDGNTRPTERFNQVAMIFSRIYKPGMNLYQIKRAVNQLMEKGGQDAAI